jgi:hypothetical protein
MHMAAHGVVLVDFDFARHLLLVDEHRFAHPPCRPAKFIPGAGVDQAELDDIDGCVHGTRSNNSMMSLFACARSRSTRGTHRHRVGRAVQVDVAAHGVDLAQPVATRLLARQPQDARQDPVAPRELPGQLRRPCFAGRPAAHEHRIRRGASADFCAHDVASAWRATAPVCSPAPLLAVDTGSGAAARHARHAARGSAAAG